MHGLIADFIHYLDVERGLARTTQVSYQQDLTTFMAWLSDQKQTTFPKIW
ncbi:tyrosine recombinase xerD, partial [Lacticaseibacillus rhamnosus MTCC 5462]